jgi:hypothetical protein
MTPTRATRFLLLTATAVACWQPRHPQTDRVSPRICASSEVPVVANPTARTINMWMTDQTLKRVENVANHQIGSPATTEYGTLPAGATDTLFDVAGDKYVWAPGGGTVTCVARPTASTALDSGH